MISLHKPFKTRIAPSPTGQLHLGHVLHLIYVHGLAKKLNAQIVVRIEDHDSQRCRPEHEASILQDLDWLGSPVPEPIWRQSERGGIYQNHLENLMSRGLIYACVCSRKDIQHATSQDSGELTYPGTCREKNIPLNTRNSALRLKLDHQYKTNNWIEFTDLFLGQQEQKNAELGGDIIIRDRYGQWTYQFSVVVDDLEQDINLVIRGRDLLASTGRQLLLRKLMAPQSQPPLFAHHPLLLADDGEKLAKRRSSEAIEYLRKIGLSADDVRGLAAFMGGLIKERRPLRKLDELEEFINVHPFNNNP